MSFSHVNGLGPNLDAYDADSTLSVARQAYFERYGLGDGGYTGDWAYVKFGCVPVVLRNTSTRKRILRAHDLHHIATGCNAIWNQGELEVTAYEVRSGVRHAFLMGWIIVLNLFTLGLILRPRQLFRCFVQSRGTRNLFGQPHDPARDSLTVAELRRQLGFSDQPLQARRQDMIAFAGASLLSIGMTLSTYGPPIAGLVWWLS